MEKRGKRPKKGKGQKERGGGGGGGEEEGKQKENKKGEKKIRGEGEWGTKWEREREW